MTVRPLLGLLMLLFLSLPLLAEMLPSTTLESVGQRWTYYTSAPVSLGKERPLVLLFHGAGGSGGSFLERSGWAAKAKQEGFMAVAASGLPRDPESPPDFLLNPRIWNSGHRLFSGPRMAIDDTRFVLDMLSDIQLRNQVDARRIYLVGHSNGATFVAKLAVTFPHRWAAIGLVQGPTVATLARLGRRVPTCAVFGEEDPILPVQGGPTQTPWGMRDTPPLAEMLSNWAQTLGYSTRAEVTAQDENQRRENYGPDFQVIYLKGHGHNYPSPDQPVIDPRFGPVKTEVPVTEAIWDFFKERTL